MKILAIIAGILLGLLFVFSAVMVLFNLAPMPEFPAGSPIANFMAAVGSTGYMKFIKVMELLGGILVAIPKTRNLGLLVLGPILVNILAFHGFITAGEGLFSPMVIAPCLIAVFLLWVERKAWLGLINR
jgi:putative oxidoreductase